MSINALKSKNMETNINITKRTDIYSIDPRNVVVVNNFNVRRDFAIDELKEQIKAQGVLNPITVIPFKDEDGKIPVETIWDAANVAMGVGSLINNIRSGNIGAAAVDGLGVVVDAAATIIPYVPGGVSSGIKAYRAGKVVVNATKTA